MAFRGKMHNAPRLTAFQQPAHQAPVRNIATHKLVPLLLCDRSQVMQIPRVGELIQIHDRAGILFHP